MNPDLHPPPTTVLHVRQDGGTRGAGPVGARWAVTVLPPPGRTIESLCTSTSQTLDLDDVRTFILKELELEPTEDTHVC